MPNKKLMYVSLIALPLAAIAVIALVLWFTSQYNAQQYAQKHDGCSQGTPNHLVVIKNDAANPTHVDANRCDTLTITNLDNENRLMAFGLHEDHVPYDGVSEHALLKNQSFTVTLIQKGDFRFHDHLHDEVQATFTVH